MKIFRMTLACLSVLTSTHGKAEDKTITIPMVTSYTVPKEENGVCTGAGTTSLRYLEAKFLFKDGGRVAKWEGSMETADGAKVLFEMDLKSINGAFQLELRAADESDNNKLFYNTIFAPSDSIVSKGFFLTARSSPAGCLQGIGASINSIDIR